MPAPPAARPSPPSPAAPDRPPVDRTPVKTDDARKVTFYLPEDLWREFTARMAYAGETSTSRYLIGALGLDAAPAATAAGKPAPTNQ